MEIPGTKLRYFITGGAGFIGSHFVDRLLDEGHEITLFTSRGSLSGEEWFDFTLKQVESWGIKYHSLKLGKPAYDLFVDDKGINVEDWKRAHGLKGS